MLFPLHIPCWDIFKSLLSINTVGQTPDTFPNYIPPYWVKYVSNLAGVLFYEAWKSQPVTLPSEEPFQRAGGGAPSSANRSPAREAKNVLTVLSPPPQHTHSDPLRHGTLSEGGGPAEPAFSKSPPTPPSLGLLPPPHLGLGHFLLMLEGFACAWGGMGGGGRERCACT